MQRPRKGILIRLCIYVPLIGYFGWSAWSKYRDEQSTSASALEPGQLPPNVQVIELSPEEAERRFGKLPDPTSDAAPKSP